MAVEHPLFAPGVPVAPEFTRIMDQAKETSLRNLRPYLPKSVEPELALFMLATLPVVTVALRAADENSRRPKPLPLPEGYVAPRVVRFPNSPAKVDAEAVAEARAAREAAEAASAAASAAAAVAAPTPAAVSEAEAELDVKLEADLENGVVAAAEADPEGLRAELARLRGELAAATKLTAKLEALERANARLMSQVADLSEQPSLQEMQRRAEKEEARCALGGGAAGVAFGGGVLYSSL